MKVLDFGLAKAFQADPSNASTVTAAGTEAGAILGTPAYMSPEQSRGRPVDKRTDVWAFGCVLFEMLTGLRAFGADTHSDTIAAILRRDPHWLALPPGVPSGLTGLLRRCLRKDHARRQRHLGDVSIELEELCDPRQADQAPSHWEAQRRAPRLLPLAWTIAALGVVVTTTVLVWSVTRRSPAAAVTRTLLSVAPASRIPMGTNGQNMAISGSSPIRVQRLTSQEARQVARRSDRMSRGPLQFQQEQLFIPHAACTSEDRFDGRVESIRPHRSGRDGSSRRRCRRDDDRGTSRGAPSPGAVASATLSPSR